jgi:dihydropyrimidinase
MKRSLKKEGITSFKVYLTYDYRLEDADLFRVIRSSEGRGNRHSGAL